MGRRLGTERGQRHEGVRAADTEVELFFRGWRGALRLDEVRRLQHPLSLEALVLASLLAAVLAQQITTGLEQLAAAEAAQQAAFPP
jgi:hypothetical protein